MTETADAAPLELPPAPRRVTPRVAKRAWGEAPVRFWWKSAAGVAIVAAVVGWGLVSNELRYRGLMTRGTPIKAAIVEVRGTSRAGYAVPRDDAVEVKLRARLPDGNVLDFQALLEPGSGYAKVGDELPIRVDPQNPRRWAEQREVLPWWRIVAVPALMLLPIALLLLGVAAWRRLRVLRVWRDGARARGVVTEVRHSATAPRSRVIRYTIADGPDRRVFKMLYPTRAGVPAPGDVLNLIVDADRPADSIVAELYAEPQARAGG